jgi:hypothetical protein
VAKKKARTETDVILFDVIYDDGTRSSRRRVLAAELSDRDDAHAKTLIMAQDRKIADMSGRDRGPIRSITRSAM